MKRLIHSSANITITRDFRPLTETQISASFTLKQLVRDTLDYSVSMLGLWLKGWRFEPTEGTLCNDPAKVVLAHVSLSPSNRIWCKLGSKRPVLRYTSPIPGFWDLSSAGPRAQEKEMTISSKSLWVMGPLLTSINTMLIWNQIIHDCLHFTNPHLSTLHFAASSALN